MTGNSRRWWGDVFRQIVWPLAPVLTWSACVAFIILVPEDPAQSAVWVAWAQAIGSVVAIFFAGLIATFQFSSQIYYERDKEHDADLQAAKQLVALLCSCRDAVVRHREKSVESVRNTPHAEFNAYQLSAIHRRIFAPDRAATEFLLRTESVKLFRTLVRFSAFIDQAVALIEKRQIFFSEEVDPKVRAISISTGTLPSIPVIAAAVDPFCAKQARLNFDAEVRAIDDLCDHFVGMRKTVLEELQRPFPESGIEQVWPEAGYTTRSWTHPISGNHYAVQILYETVDSNVQLQHRFIGALGTKTVPPISFSVPLPDTGILAAHGVAATRIDDAGQVAISLGLS